MSQLEQSPMRVREVVTLEKFEVEDHGRRLVEIIRIEDGVVTHIEHPALPQGG